MHMTARTALRRQLDIFDATNPVVGSAISVDIYVVPALGAKLLGPASLLVWFAGGVIVIVSACSSAHFAASF